MHLYTLVRKLLLSFMHVLSGWQAIAIGGIFFSLLKWFVCDLLFFWGPFFPSYLQQCPVGASRCRVEWRHRWWWTSSWSYRQGSPSTFVRSLPAQHHLEAAASGVRRRDPGGTPGRKHGANMASCHEIFQGGERLDLIAE